MTTYFYVNNEKLKENNPKEILLYCFFSANLNLWSADALHKFLFGTLRLLLDFCQEKKFETSKEDRVVKSRYSRFSSWANKMLKHQNTRFTRETVLKRIYDIILTCEGMHTLSGFAMTNKHKDPIPFNPEFVSIYNLGPLKETSSQEVYMKIVYDQIITETDLAVYLDFGGRLEWIPKSQIRNLDDLKSDGHVDVPKFIVYEKGLEGFSDEDEG